MMAGPVRREAEYDVGAGVDRETPDTADGYPPRRRAWGACLILTLGCILAYMDRGILSLFVTPIQRDLALSDTQISLLIGLAFSVFNAVFGLPIARLIDRGDRRMIAALGVFAWSAANGVCGIASSFWQMFSARVGVGVGEAAVTPAAVSLLADYFPPSRRGAAMGVFYSGLFLGAGGVLIGGGTLWHALGDRTIVLPLLGAVHSWQVILLMFASLGLVVGPMTLLIREPRRLTGGAVATTASGESISVRGVLTYYRHNARTLLGHNLGFCLHGYMLLAGAAWLPTILMRTQGWSLPRAGIIFGIVTLLMGPAGSIFAGILADRLVAQGRSDGRLIVAMIAALTAAVACSLIGTVHSPIALIVALAIFSFAGSCALPTGPGALQDIMPNAMRGQSVAIFVFLLNVVAGGTAATAVAMLTEYGFRDPMKLAWSFAIVGTLSGVGAFLILGMTRAPFRAAVARLQPGSAS